LKRWNTMPVMRRWRAISVSLSGCSASPTIRYPVNSPSSQMAPASMRSSWLMHRKRVVLPEPDGPMTQTTSLGITSSVTSSSALTDPKDLPTRTADTSGVIV
jgi:hypothetical protein